MQKNDVFISYRRVDIDFAKQLAKEFEDEGYSVWADWDDIPPGALNFATEITDGIEGAHAMVCILSNAYMESEYCLGEMAHAVSNSKRIVPVVLEKGFSVDLLPDSVKSVNWVYFTPHLNQQNDFTSAYPKLKEALFTDWEHTQQHTDLTLKAQEWDRGDHQVNYLLTGHLIKQAEDWLKSADEKGLEPKPSKLLREYVTTSRTQQRKMQRRIITSVAVGVVITILAILSVILWQRSEASLDIAARLAQSANGLLIFENKDPASQELAVSLAVHAAETGGETTEAAVQQSLAQIAYSPGMRQFIEADDGALVALEFSPDATRVLSRSVTDITTLWDANTGEEIARYERTLVDLPIAFFAPDGETLWRIVDGGAIEIINSADGSVQQILENHSETLERIVFSPDGTMALSYSMNELIVWNLETLEPLLETGKENGEWVTFAPDQYAIMTSNLHDELSIIDIETGEEIDSYEMEMFSWGYTPDNRYFVDPTTSLTQIVPKFGVYSFGDNYKINDRNLGEILDSDERFLVALEYSIGADNQVSVLPYNVEDNSRRVERTQPVIVGDVSNDGRTLLTVDVPFFLMNGQRVGAVINIMVENVITGNVLLEIQHPLMSPFNDFSNNTAMSGYPVDLSEDGRRLLIADGSNFAIWDIIPGLEVWEQPVNSQSVSIASGRVAYSPDGSYVALERQEIDIDVLDAQTGNRIIDYTLETASFMEGGLSDFNTHNERFLHLPGLTGNTTNSDNGIIGSVYYDLLTGEELDPAPQGGISTMFTPDGQALIRIVGAENGGVNISARDFDGTEIVSYEPPIDNSSTWLATFSDDLRYVIYAITAGGPEPWMADGMEIIIHDLETDTDIARFSQENASTLDMVSFSDDMSLVLYPDVDRSTLILKNLETGEIIHRLTGHDIDVTSVAIAPDMSFAVSGDRLGNTIFWDLEAGIELRRFQEATSATGDVYVAISPDSKTFVTNTDITTVMRRVDSLPELIEWTKENRLVRPLTDAELSRYGAG